MSKQTASQPDTSIGRLAVLRPLSCRRINVSAPHGQVVGPGDVVPGERLQARSLACFVLDRVHAVGQLSGAGQRLRPLTALDDRERGILSGSDGLRREAHHPVRMQRFGPTTRRRATLERRQVRLRRGRR